MVQVNENKNRKKGKKFAGKLSRDQICEGINIAVSNANRLVSDAELLFQNKRYPSALGLAILAIEESGKISILRGMAVARNAEDLAESWNQYRSHLSKNSMWIFPGLVNAGGRVIDDFKKAVYKDSDHTYMLDALKQVSFYTDCYGGNIWSNPNDVIQEDIVEGILNIAKILTKAKKEVTITELDLWIKHLGPVWKKDMESMKDALIEWAAEMKANGLMDYKGEEGLTNFLNGKKWVH
jgi:AbiV family abortive infection protein